MTAMRKPVYADNAATTPLCKEAFAAMEPFLLQDWGNASQPYSLARPAKKALKEARETIASCIGAHPDEILFTSGGTESDNWAIKCAGAREGGVIADREGGDGAHRMGGSAGAREGGRQKVVTSSFEHHAVLHSCQALQRAGVPVAYIGPNREGIIEPGTLAASLDDSVVLASVMFANNELGTIQPIAQLCEEAHRAGALFHTDAVQAVGHVPINVRELGVDLLSASAHKFNGPKGMGFLYCKQGTRLRPFMDGGAQEGGMRAGTENIAGIVGMAKALEVACAKMDECERKLHALEQIILNGLSQSGVRFLLNTSAKTLPGIMSISFPGHDAEGLLHRLDLMGVCVSTGSACDSKNTQISHVLQAIGLPEDQALGTLRISLGRMNDEEDAARLVEAFASIFSTENNRGEEKC